MLVRRSARGENEASIGIKVVEGRRRSETESMLKCPEYEAEVSQFIIFLF